MPVYQCSFQRGLLTQENPGVCRVHFALWAPASNPT